MSTGRTSTYIRKTSPKETVVPNVGYKKTRFLHQAAAGDTLIQLSSLTTPSAVVGYSAPNVSELVSTNLMQWSSNLTLTSSLRGVLIQNLSWVASGASTIKLLFEAADGEVFDGVIDHVMRVGTTLADAEPLVQSGTLPAGDTDFNVGSPFRVGLYSSTSHGAVLVYVDGQLMLRNTGNNVIGPGVSGDYYEVHSGEGLGQIIRFNAPDLTNDREVSVLSVGSLVERPNGSMMAVIESLQGQIDAIVPTVAALAEVDETTFQAAPNNVDLKSFGDRVFAAEEQVEDHEVRIDVLEERTSTPSVQVMSNHAQVDIQVSGAGSLGQMEIDLVNFTPGTDGPLLEMLVSVDNGANYLTGASDYSWATVGNDGVAGIDTDVDQADDSVVLTGAVVGSDVGETVNCKLIVWAPGSASMYKHFSWQMSMTDSSGNHRGFSGAGKYNALTPITHIRLRFTSGVIESGLAVARRITNT